MRLFLTLLKTLLVPDIMQKQIHKKTAAFQVYVSILGSISWQQDRIIYFIVQDTT